MDLESARSDLVYEARELLTSMETALLEIEREGYDYERINAVFRAAHTIKGSAGLFGLTSIEQFCQRAENLLDSLRAGRVAPSPQLFALMIECGDYIARLVDAIEQRREHEDPAPELRARLLHELTRAGEVRTSRPVPPTLEAEATAKLLHLSVRFAPHILADGLCPTAYLRHLAELGDLLYVCTITDDLPPVARYQAHLPYLRFEVGLRTQGTARDVKAAFALARDAAQVEVLSANAPRREHAALLAQLVNERERLEEHWRAHGFYVADPPEPARVAEHASAVVQTSDATRVDATNTRGDERKHDERRSPDARMVKVDASRLDHMIDLVGELVIASEGARTTAASPSTSRGDVLEAVGRVSQLVEQIRDRALTMRMTPIGDIFQRFPRVVRDVSKELGKQIELEITGAESELDKSMVERLADPLLHIVRNAIDHGIEPTVERAASGKPEVGHLRLHAHAESGSIVVEVKDDGRGLDPERLRKKGVERGVIGEHEVLTTQQCYALIFAPGFSTAAEVTNISGRGVGMDVVKRNLELLRGEIEIESERGRGTTFRLRLPLTLAIIEGFHVSVADTTFVIPLDMVVECVDMREQSGQQHVFNLRGSPLPYMRLRDVFRFDGPGGARESLVVVSAGQLRVGLVVDRLLGNSQAVIKPLGQLFRGLHGVSASTIVGDGSVALILDVPALVTMAMQRAGSSAFHAYGQEGASP